MDSKSKKKERQEVLPAIFNIERTVLKKKNLDDLYEATQDRIAESILEYICYEHSNNSFGFGYIDPDEFAKMFGYSPRYLKEKHPKPYQETINQIPEKRNGGRNEPLTDLTLFCANRFQNALFALARYPLTVITSFFANGKDKDLSVDVILIIKKFNVHQDGATGKFIYQYQLADEFRRTLDTYYVKANVNSFVNLRKAGLASFYYFILQLKEALFSQGKTSTTIDNTPDFNYLCNLAEISPNLDNRHKKQELKKVFKRLSTDTEIKIEVEWASKTDKEKYIPILHFEPTKTDFIFYPENQRANNVYLENEKIRVAVIEFKHNLIKSYPNGELYKKKDAINIFYDWLKTDTEEFYEILDLIFRNTILNIGCKLPKDIPERIKLFHKLVMENPPETMDTWMQLLFSGTFRLWSKKFKPITEPEMQIIETF